MNKDITENTPKIHTSGYAAHNYRSKRTDAAHGNMKMRKSGFEEKGVRLMKRDCQEGRALNLIRGAVYRKNKAANVEKKSDLRALPTEMKP